MELPKLTITVEGQDVTYTCAVRDHTTLFLDQARSSRRAWYEAPIQKDLTSIVGCGELIFYPEEKSSLTINRAVYSALRVTIKNGPKGALYVSLPGDFTKAARKKFKDQAEADMIVFYQRNLKLFQEEAKKRYLVRCSKMILEQDAWFEKARTELTEQKALLNQPSKTTLL